MSRGRGDAEMTFGEESAEQGAKFKERAIPEGIADENGDLIKTRFAAPEVNPIAPDGRAAARATRDATGEQTWAPTLRPRHREAIKNYFSSSPPK